MNEDFAGNGNKLAATREDMAQFRGETVAKLDSLNEAVNRLASVVEGYSIELEKVKLRVTKLETQDKISQHDENQERETRENRLSRRRETRGWIAVAISLFVVLLDVLSRIYGVHLGG